MIETGQSYIRIDNPEQLNTILDIGEKSVVVKISDLISGEIITPTKTINRVFFERQVELNNFKLHSDGKEEQRDIDRIKAEKEEKEPEIKPEFNPQPIIDSFISTKEEIAKFFTEKFGVLSENKDTIVYNPENKTFTFTYTINDSVTKYENKSPDYIESFIEGLKLGLKQSKNDWEYEKEKRNRKKKYSYKNFTKTEPSVPYHATVSDDGQYKIVPIVNTFMIVEMTVQGNYRILTLDLFDSIPEAINYINEQ